MINTICLPYSYTGIANQRFDFKRATPSKKTRRVRMATLPTAIVPIASVATLIPIVISMPTSARMAAGREMIESLHTTLWLHENDSIKYASACAALGTAWN